MGTLTSQCTRCKHLVSVDTEASATAQLRCTFCGTRQRQLIYSVFAQDPVPAPNTLLQEEGASCFFHENAAAANLCDDCGRYLCDLCTLDIPMPASSPPDFPERVCPACFENRVNEEVRDQRWDLFRTRYPRYDVMAAFLIVMPIVFFPLMIFSIITLPMALYIVFRNWRTCHTPVQHFRGGMLLAAALALAGVTIWLSLLGFTAAEWL